MNPELLSEVIACLPKGRTHYRYFKGAYAPQLLSMLINEEASVRALKTSRLKRLLGHPLVKPVVAQSGNGQLSKVDLDGVWQEPSLPFLLSVSRWGGKGERDWYQKSRHGENLVLQLNLPVENQRQLNKWVDPSGERTINASWSQHPVQKRHKNQRFRDTLAWSRIDLDFKHNEALIEEVQSDSVRSIKRWASSYKRCGCDECKLKTEYIRWFDRYSKIWSEAMLMATISFIKEELGIDRIFMHTARSGWQVKK